MGAGKREDAVERPPQHPTIRSQPQTRAKGKQAQTRNGGKQTKSSESVSQSGLLPALIMVFHEARSEPDHHGTPWVLGSERAVTNGHHSIRRFAPNQKTSSNSNSPEEPDTGSTKTKKNTGCRNRPKPARTKWMTIPLQSSPQRSNTVISNTEKAPQGQAGSADVQETEARAQARKYRERFDSATDGVTPQGSRRDRKTNTTNKTEPKKGKEEDTRITNLRWGLGHQPDQTSR